MGSPADQPRKEAGLTFARGVLHSIAWTVIGMILPILVELAFILVRWVVQGSNELDRAYDLYWLPREIVFPGVGLGVVLGATGWATYAPNGKHRFAATFAIIFGISVPAWLILGSLGMTPPRYKAIEHPLLYPSEFLVIAIPPLIGAIVISSIRCRKPSAGRFPESAPP